MEIEKRKRERERERERERAPEVNAFSGLLVISYRLTGQSNMKR